MSYTHFTIEERCCLREYDKKGCSYRKIAELLSRNVSSVSGELRRNCTRMYGCNYTKRKARRSVHTDLRALRSSESIGLIKRKRTNTPLFRSFWQIGLPHRHRASSFS